MVDEGNDKKMSQNHIPPCVFPPIETLCCFEKESETLELSRGKYGDKVSFCWQKEFSVVWKEKSQSYAQYSVFVNHVKSQFHFHRIVKT